MNGQFAKTIINKTLKRCSVGNIESSYLCFGEKALIDQFTNTSKTKISKTNKIWGRVAIVFTPIVT